MVIDGTLKPVDKLGDDSPNLIRTGVSTDDADLIMAMTSKELYSNPIGSMVREIVSNGWDANMESGSNKAVIVKIEYDFDSDNYYFIVEDNGIGITQHRMDTVYRLWFKSTKRDNNKAIGGWGLGSKSPLACSDNFTLITTCEGYRYEYLIYEDYPENKIEPLGKEQVTPHTPTGTIIKVPINGYTDKIKVENEFKKQCAYFDNVYYKESSYNNNYSIYEFRTFKYRQYCPFDKMHIVLGKVHYPIDFNMVFGKSEYLLNFAKIPIGIKFDVGELGVTLSREQLKYRPNDKELIKQRVEEAVQELLEFAKKQRSNISTLEELYDKEKKHIKIHFDENTNIKLPNEYELPLMFADIPNAVVSHTLVDYMLYYRETYSTNSKSSVTQYTKDGFKPNYVGYYLENPNISIDQYMSMAYPSTYIYKFRPFNKEFVRRFLELNEGTFAFRRNEFQKRMLPINNGIRVAKQVYDYLANKVKNHSNLKPIDLDYVQKVKFQATEELREARREYAEMKKQSVTLYPFNVRRHGITLTMGQLIDKKYAIIFCCGIDEFNEDYMRGIRDVLKVNSTFPTDKMLFVSCSKDGLKKLSKLENTLGFNDVFNMKMFHNLFRLIRTSYMLGKNKTFLRVKGISMHLKGLSPYYESVYKPLEKLQNDYKYQGDLLDKILKVCQAHNLSNPSIGKEIEKLTPLLDITNELHLVSELVGWSYKEIRYSIYYKLFGHMRRLHPKVYEAGIEVKKKRKELLTTEINQFKTIVKNGKVNIETSRTNGGGEKTETQREERNSIVQQ